MCNMVSVGLCEFQRIHENSRKGSLFSMFRTIGLCVSKHEDFILFFRRMGCWIWWSEFVFLVIWSELTVQCVGNRCLFTGKVNLAHYLWTLLLELDQLNYMRQIGTAKRLDKKQHLCQHFSCPQCSRVHGMTEHHVWDSFNNGTALRALSLGGLLWVKSPERIPLLLLFLCIGFFSLFFVDSLL